MTAKTKFRLIAGIMVTLMLLGLLYWQETRYQLIGECLSRGWQWDGPSNRCRPAPRIYIDRGLRKT